MKKFICLLLALFAFLGLTACDGEKQPLDVIEDYTIYVHPTEEGNLEMRYKITWHVLDSEKEGPLEWVRIGVPNQYAFHLEALSPAISSIKHDTSNGSYIRLDLNRPYMAGETVILEFSFLQTHIYTLKDDKVEYRFIPGWFDDIQVKELMVCWEKSNVIYHNSNQEDDTYYIWKESLDYGESIQIDLRYKQESFVNLSTDNTYSNDDGDFPMTVVIAITIIVLIFIFIAIFSAVRDDGYYAHRGFSGRINFWHWSWWHTLTHRGVDRHGEKLPHIKNNGSSGGGGSSCACACACACAGGGRAGCSRKDFYQSELEINKIIKKLDVVHCEECKQEKE